uniref:Uncharacterized protein n=1 Tax=Ditylum brightwellii TaxID=49249 RepID=A0A7S4WK86_9STRA
MPLIYLRSLNKLCLQPNMALCNIRQHNQTCVHKYSSLYQISMDDTRITSKTASVVMIMRSFLLIVPLLSTRNLLKRALISSMYSLSTFCTSTEERNSARSASPLQI